MTRVAPVIVGLMLLALMPLASAQFRVGEDLEMKAGGLLSAGYEGDYGDGNQFESNHGLNFGFDGNVSGSYYNPNFLSFSLVPYFNQSRANSSYQSLTGASGVSGSANLFAGSHFPGTISYRNDYNSTGTFGLSGQPDFTTHGHGQGFGVGWSALLPDLPTLSVSYSQGSGSGTVYGTDQQTGSDTKLFNVRSNYAIEGFRLNGYFDHDSLRSTVPEFLAGEQDSVSNTTGHDFGFGTTHNLPLRGTFYSNYSRAQSTTDFLDQGDSTSSYTTSTETSGATFHPLAKLSLFVNQSYTDNLSGYLNQNLINSGTVQTPFDLGSGSNSLTLSGGATYQFTNFLSAQSQATYYDQYYFGKSYTGTYITGTVYYSRKLLNMFSFSGGVVESSNGRGSNAVGFVGNLNYFRRIKGWETSGSFSYAQNVQSFLITYTTSYYNYTARLHRRFGRSLVWTVGFSGNHSGLTNQAGSGNHSESYSTSFTIPRFTLTGNFTQASGNSILTSTGLVNLPPTPGVPINSFILYGGSSYGGGISATPLRRLTLSASYSRALSNTLSDMIDSHNNTEIFNAQMQYHLRKIGLLSGYTRFTQGISASGAPPGTSNSYFIGVSRWFDFF
ncbi:MAG: hypothetical protein WB952_03075 [Terriglobales bacterium]